MLRIGQHRLAPALRRLSDHRAAAVAIPDSDKTRRQIATEERDAGALAAICYRKSTSGLIAIR